MANHPGGNGARDRHETAAYVAEMTGELASMARRHGLDALGYLLEMAKLEAESAARRATAGEPGNRIPRR